MIVFLSVLSFVGVSNAWFLDLNKKFGKTGKLAKAPSSNRKVVLEPRIAYFPVSVITDENDKPILGSPFAPPLAAPGSVYEGRQQPEYASLYAQPPLVMYGSPETAGTIYSAPAPVSGQYHAVYSYLAADPYAQYAAAPLEVNDCYLVSSWLIVIMYLLL